MSAFGSTLSGLSRASAGTSTHACAASVNAPATTEAARTSLRRAKVASAARRAAWSGSASKGGAIQCGSATGLQTQSAARGTDGSAKDQKRSCDVASSLRRRTRSRRTMTASQATSGER